MKTLEQLGLVNDEDSGSAATKHSLLLSSKIETQHLARLAVVFVRQSSPRQVRENIESTQLQYDLARRAQSYGCPHSTEHVNGRLKHGQQIISDLLLRARADFAVELQAETAVGLAAAADFDRLVELDVVRQKVFDRIQL